MKIENFKKGLYIGRFQPFHLGHLSAIKQALKQVDKLYIGIGSSQYDHTPENPFTAEERQKMIELALKEADLEDQCAIYLIPDIHDEAKWVEHVKSIIPSFEMVFVGNEGIVKTLFEKEKVPVMQVKKEFDISATKIRQSIKTDEDWQKMVSPAIADFLVSIEAKIKIKKLK